MMIVRIIQKKNPVTTPLDELKGEKSPRNFLSDQPLFQEIKNIPINQY
jgi:hypothetical protein